ncbi:hypothetical protein MMC25_006685 [Agyrium rufum]|nr:hypothetical protein [Agyrium rufum]
MASGSSRDSASPHDNEVTHKKRRRSKSSCSEDEGEIEDVSGADKSLEDITRRSTSVEAKATEHPPLPTEAPPLPEGAPPDDGWEPVWDGSSQAFYFYNRITGKSQWDNPRVPEAIAAAPPGVEAYDKMPYENGTGGAPATSEPLPPPPPANLPHGGYNPAIHGDYDPNADYAQLAKAAEDQLSQQQAQGVDPVVGYAATGTFNRFTGKWQASTLAPENFNDESKSKRQMNAFFDVDAAANSHNGRSLKAERSGKKLTKQELKTFKEKRKEKKEERRRAWLRD